MIFQVCLYHLLTVVILTVTCLSSLFLSILLGLSKDRSTLIFGDPQPWIDTSKMFSYCAICPRPGFQCVFLLRTQFFLGLIYLFFVIIYNYGISLLKRINTPYRQQCNCLGYFFQQPFLTDALPSFSHMGLQDAPINLNSITTLCLSTLFTIAASVFLQIPPILCYSRPSQMELSAHGISSVTFSAYTSICLLQPFVFHHIRHNFCQCVYLSTLTSSPLFPMGSEHHTNRTC